MRSQGKVDWQRLGAAARLLPLLKVGSSPAWRMEVVMATENELFYLVLLTMLTLIIHLILSIKARRHDRR
jgi:hypothetical protein